MMSRSSYPHKPPKGLRHVGLEARQACFLRISPRQAEDSVLRLTYVHLAADEQVAGALDPVM